MLHYCTILYNCTFCTILVAGCNGLIYTKNEVQYKNAHQPENQAFLYKVLSFPYKCNTLLTFCHFIASVFFAFDSDCIFLLMFYSHNYIFLNVYINCICFYFSIKKNVVLPDDSWDDNG